MRLTRQARLEMAVLGLGIWTALTVAVEAADPREPASFDQIVRHHFEKYPSMEIEDLYKLVFQAAMGSEHAVPNREAAQQWLERELETLTVVPQQPFSEPLSPGGDLVRVNLRSFATRGGDMEALLDAFIKTAEQVSASEEKLREHWADVEAMAEAGEIPFGKSELQELFAQMESRGFPAIHHSSTYRKQYEPAYRVVLLEYLRSDAIMTTGQ